jgi:hypothetical protein
MKIKPTYTTFEQAKWLKEKGFDIWVSKHYDGYSPDKLRCSNGFKIPRCCPQVEPFDYMSLNQVYYAPEQWQVVEWLLQNHRLDIIIKYPESKTNKVEGINSVYYDLEIYRLQGGDAYKLYKFIGISDNKQKAYSAAFDYILNTLI